MSYNVAVAVDAVSAVKYLGKKHRSFKGDFANFLTELESNPIQGEPLGKDCYKIRFSISSKNKGKSGGARAITCVKVIDERVIILSVYDKSDIDTISDNEIEQRLKNADLL